MSAGRGAECPVERKDELHASSPHCASHEPGRESIAQCFEHERERLYRSRAPIELDSFFGHFGRPPNFKWNVILAIQKLHHILNALAEARSQRSARQLLEIAARVQAEIRKP